MMLVPSNIWGDNSCERRGLVQNIGAGYPYSSRGAKECSYKFNNYKNVGERIKKLRTKRCSSDRSITSSLVLGSTIMMVALLISPTHAIHRMQSMRQLSASSTGFYTEDMAFFTVNPCWGPSPWTVDFSTESLKKLNELLYSTSGLENKKGSIMCTDAKCLAHGKATTSVLVGADDMITVTLEIAASSFEVFFNCPAGLDVSVVQLSCEDDLGTDCANANAIFPEIALGGTSILPFHYPAELTEPSLVRLVLKYTCLDCSLVANAAACAEMQLQRAFAAQLAHHEAEVHILSDYHCKVRATRPPTPMPMEAPGDEPMPSTSPSQAPSVSLLPSESPSVMPVDAPPDECEDNFMCPDGKYVVIDQEGMCDCVECDCTAQNPPRCAVCPVGTISECVLDEELGVKVPICRDCACGACSATKIDANTGESFSCCELNGGNNNCKNSQNAGPECNINMNFFPGLSTSGDICSGVELSNNAVANGCGCQPSATAPCIYNEDTLMEDNRCYICNVRYLVEVANNLDPTAVCNKCITCIDDNCQMTTKLEVKNPTTAAFDSGMETNFRNCIASEMDPSTFARATDCVANVAGAKDCRETQCFDLCLKPPLLP